MNSEELSEQIKNFKVRLAESERALEAAENPDKGLELQREHNALTAYITRLTGQLDTALREKLKAKKRQDELSLETELEQTRAEHADIRAEMAGAVRELVPALEATYDAVKRLYDRQRELERCYETLYLKRFGVYPEDPKVELKGYGFTPHEDSASYEATAFALELVHHELNRDGWTLADVHRGLNLVYRKPVF